MEREVERTGAEQAEQRERPEPGLVDDDEPGMLAGTDRDVKQTARFRRSERPAVRVISADWARMTHG